MPQSTPNTPSATPATFAGLLAALAEPAQKPSPAWSDEDLADDVATLSYENALRTHARYPSAPLADSPAQETMAHAPVAFPIQEHDAADELAESLRAMTPLERGIKRASVTIRMSQEESEQLHKRAGEAGMTVSAYLRSCAFEVENLRALVKETMTQLTAATEKQHHLEAEKMPPQRDQGILSRLTQHFTPARPQERAVRA